MKKLSLLFILLIVCFTSMNFGGCFERFVACYPETGCSNSGAGGHDEYGANSTPLFYNIFVGNNGSILRSVNNNNLITYSVITSGTTQNLNDVRISNNYYQNDVAVVGNNGTVLISDNSGLNWLAKTPVTSANLYGVDHSYFLYAVGDNGTILYANEIITGNLVQRTSGTTRNLKAVTISNLNTQRVIAVGEKGTIVRTTNGGFNWENVSIPDTTFNFYDLSQKGIYYGTGDIFVAVGSGGRIYKSTDNGATWQQKTSGTTNTLRSIYFQTLDSGIVVGDNGTVRCTTNGGETWYSNSFFNSPASRNFRCVMVINNLYKTFAAISDTVFYVSNEPVTFTAILPVSGEIPDNFTLSQNYPNPFNPTTVISFQLAVNSFATLKIYDLSGREVTTLVNEQLKPGTYEIDFDGSKYSSGIYFYKLEANEFVETRKMILIK